VLVLPNAGDKTSGSILDHLHTYTPLSPYGKLWTSRS